MTKSKKFTNFVQLIKDQDVFTESIAFTFDKGQTQFKTKIGGLCSLLMFTIVLAYALWQAIIIFKYQQYTINVHTQSKFYDTFNEFGINENMTFAFNMENGVDEDFGRVRAYYENWAPGMEKFELTEIQTRNCTPEDLELTKIKQHLCYTLLIKNTKIRFYGKCLRCDVLIKSCRSMVILTVQSQKCCL